MAVDLRDPARGLSLNASTGLISGTPNTPVTATPLTFKVTDSGSPAQTATTTGLTLTILPATLTITTMSLSTGVVDVSYSQTLAATGGTGAYTWQLTSRHAPGRIIADCVHGIDQRHAHYAGDRHAAHLQGDGLRFARADGDGNFTLTISLRQR